jgi:hypothetical protein
MNEAQLEQIVQAVLYEGYLLYPYRASAKNHPRQRFTFGRVYPRECGAAQKGAEPFMMQTECLVKPGNDVCALTVTVRFLHPLSREVGRLPQPLSSWKGEAASLAEIVAELEVDGQRYCSWLEAVEQRVAIASVKLAAQTESHSQFPFEFSGCNTVEPIKDKQGRVPAVFVRRQDGIQGAVEIILKKENGFCKATVRILNLTQSSESETQNTEAVLMRTFASTHTILTLQGGEFISLLEPPREHQAIASSCKNIGTWPVLVGDEEKRECDTMLSSPIILYDYPKIAPESAGSLFDGTEIDEILSLRILTLTEQEKLDARAVDEHARRLLERTEALPSDAFLAMHGMMRRELPNETKPAEGSPSPGGEGRGEGDRDARQPGQLHTNEVQVHGRSPIEFDDFFGANRPLKGIRHDGAYFQPGTRVRLRPKARADAIDLALAGQVAVVEAVEQDMEGRIYLAVVLENDPGKDLGLLRQPGHRFFYGLDEVEPLSEEVEIS